MSKLIYSLFSCFFFFWFLQPPPSTLFCFTLYYINYVCTRLQRLDLCILCYFCFLQEFAVVSRINFGTFVFNRNKSACSEGAQWEMSRTKTHTLLNVASRLFKWPTNMQTMILYKLFLEETRRERERESECAVSFHSFVRNLFRHFYELKNNINKRERYFALSADFLLVLWRWLLLWAMSPSFFHSHIQFYVFICLLSIVCFPLLSFRLCFFVVVVFFQFRVNPLPSMGFNEISCCVKWYSNLFIHFPAKYFFSHFERW